MKEILPGAWVLVLAVHEHEILKRETLRAGASGYIIKRAVESELISAIHSVADDEVYVHPAMTRLLLRGPSAQAASHKRAPTALTRCETEVLRLIANVHTDAQVAEVLGISVRTLESRRVNLLGKLGLQSRVELVRYAIPNQFPD